MSGSILLDTNLAVLLIVGGADRRLVSSHKRLSRYTTDHLDLLAEIIGRYSDLVFIPYVLAESLNLARQIDGPARRKIGQSLRRLVEASTELPVFGVQVTAHPGFMALGLTDAALLLVAAQVPAATLATADKALADNARALSCAVIDFHDI